jgi:alcohol dehydrogenase class IV
MDAAKVIAFMTTHPGNAWEYTIEMGERARRITGEVPPIVAVPTTAGTGSEVSQSSSITNPSTRQKSPIRSPRIGPLYAVVDPELTVPMPKGLTASTGFEAFCLSFEKFLAPESFPLIDSLAEAAMKGVVRNLKKAMDDPRNLEARSVMMWESTQGGLCDLAGIRGTGLHAFSLPLSALFDLPRGESLALCMPIVIARIAKLRPRKVSRLLSVFEDSGSDGVFLSERESSETAARRMGEWMKEIGLASRLRKFGIGEGALKELAGSINIERLRDAWERDVSRSEIEELYGSIL